MPKKKAKKKSKASVKPKGTRIEVYTRDDGRFGWRLISRNGNLMGLGAEGDGYPTLSNAKRGLKSVLRVIQGAPVVVLPATA